MIRSKLTRPLAAIVLVATCVGRPLAQSTRVVPGSAATKVGTGGPGLLFAFAHPKIRMQQVVSAPALAKVSAKIDAIAFRRDGVNTAAYPAFTFTQLTVKLGHTRVGPWSLSTEFDKNPSGAMTVAYQGNLRVSAAPYAGPNLPPWSVAMKLTRPFVFTASAGNLLIELTWTGSDLKSPQYWLLDGDTRWPVTEKFGSPGPFVHQGSYQTVTDRSDLSFGGKIDLESLGNFTQAYPAVAVFGCSRTRFGPLALPFDLTALGAPSNHLYVSMDLVLPHPMIKISHVIYAGRTILAIPQLMQPRSIELFAQLVFLDPKSNALGLVFSAAERFAWGQASDLELIWRDDPLAKHGWRWSENHPRTGGLYTRLSGTFN